MSGTTAPSVFSRATRSRRRSVKASEIPNRSHLFRVASTARRLPMLFDYVLRNGRIAGGGPDPVDVGVRDGRIAVIASGAAMSARDSSRDIALDGRLMIPGFVETHIHLDKSCISDRCNCVTGTVQEAIAAAAAANRAST